MEFKRQQYFIPSNVLYTFLSRNIFIFSPTRMFIRLINFDVRITSKILPVGTYLIENNFKVIKTRIGRNFSFFFKFVPREEVFQVRENDSFESDLTACSLIKKTGTG